jgi:uncharacterized membrane protein YphA (DoxX/SURF4 family)
MKQLPLASWRHRLNDLTAKASSQTERFFFAETGPQGLAIIRVVFYSFVAWNAYFRGVAKWASAPSALWKPVAPLAWLPEPIFSSEVLEGVQVSLCAACICCALGLGYRFFAMAAVPLALVFFGLPNSFGKINHGSTLAMIALLVFAVSKAEAAWSVDAWLKRRHGLPAPAPSAEFNWPLRTMQVMFALVMFGAGLSKLRTAGLEWALSDNLLYTMLKRHYQGEAQQAGTLSLYLISHPWLCRLLAAGSLLVELTAPLALISRRYRWFVIPSLLSMQVGIYFTMHISFHYFMLLYIVWVEWNELFAWMRSWYPTPPRGTDFPATLPPVPDVLVAESCHRVAA